MNDQKLQNKINQLKPWYQGIKLNDKLSIKSDHSKWSGDFSWNYIFQIIKDSGFSLKNKRVLDLGSNAGLFSIRSAQAGAQEVVGVELDSRHILQSKFIHDFFSEQDGKNYNVSFRQGTCENIVNEKLGHFDLTLAISVLYHVGLNGTKHYTDKHLSQQESFIKKLCGMSDNVIVRTRNKPYNNGDYYSKTFLNFGFKTINRIDEKENERSLLFLSKS
jgi:cyclopropane fatty-acyl-phospholipid synthase-like methyltransferase